MLSKFHLFNSGKTGAGTIWLIIAIFVTAMLARIIPGPRTIDDAYITYRYVQNIVSGHGFVYNLGEQVLGTTTPFYTLLLAVISSILKGVFENLVLISLIINAIADSIGCILLFAIGKRLGYALAGLGAALVWSIAPFSVTIAIGGLETSLLVGLILITWYLVLSERFRWVAFSASLLILTRPDALILVGLLICDRCVQVFLTFKALPELNIHTIIKKNRHLFSEAAILTLPLGAWIVFAWIYFGSPIPHSITAKSLAYQLPPESALVRFVQHYGTPFMDQYTLTGEWLLLTSILYLYLSLFGAQVGVRAHSHSWPFFVYPWLYMLIFSIANPLIFRWYLTPPLPVYILSILIGLQCLVQKLSKYIYLAPSLRKASKYLYSVTSSFLAILLIVIIPFTLTLQGWQTEMDHGASRLAPEMAWIKLEKLYEQASDILAENEPSFTNPQVTLAAGDIGVLGYSTGAKILDLVGLTSPLATLYYPTLPAYYVINYAIPPELILDQMPDYLVILEVYGRESLLKNQEFLNSYQLLEKIETDIYGSDGLLIFRCKDA